MADSVPQDATAATNDLAPMFRRMLVLMEEQNKMIAEQGTTLKSHGTMLETLKTDALKKKFARSTYMGRTQEGSCGEDEGEGG
ncbi:hypothetical protein SISSUDRAFT_709116 [Sistotremastrum suecicum HHB10207 ss-3]|uniref:Uncharacterized protein n=1 Tax=Sistotremastrum suecicum HHB10207 ss-3 TaxID=1314776 RepID=A0A166DUS0_9AGAM|nr:hypothetical protein SISSUDRAFT_709116 [Sistotremastrum suecicum HHB10207 ss-3]